MKSHKDAVAGTEHKVAAIEEKFHKVHGNKFTYTNAFYKNNKTEIVITCPVHGDFVQRPDSHIRGVGCSKCSGKYNYTTEEYVVAVNAIHNNKYDYSETRYTKTSENISIKCPIHGIYTQRAGNHLKGKGCRECGGSQSHTQEDILDKFYSVHGTTYNYTDMTYINYHTPIKVICNEHGPFYPTPANHLKGTTCPSCANYGFNPRIPAILYYFKIEDVWKIGVTNNTLKRRYLKRDRDRMTDIKVVRFKLGSEAYQQEQEIIKLNKTFLYTGPTPFTDGTRTTECFTKDIIQIEIKETA